VINLVWRSGEVEQFESVEAAELALPEGYAITDSDTFGCDDADEDGRCWHLAGFVEVAS